MYHISSLMRKLILSILLLLFHLLSFAQAEAPDFRCLNADPAGSITLTWIQPSNSTGFLSYQVYYSTQQTGIPYVAVSPLITDFNTVSYTHIIDPNDNHWYFIRAQFTSDTKDSDTLKSLFLESNYISPDNVKFQWDKISDPPPSSASPFYRLYMEYPPGTVTKIYDNTDNFYELETFNFCNQLSDDVYFWVEQDDNSGCTSVSSVSNHLLYNWKNPSEPNLDSVSVINNQVHLGWQSNPEGDIGGYIIFGGTGDVNESFDTLYGGATTYIHEGVDPCNGSFTYAIAAIDSCGNTSPGTFFNPQRSLLIQSIQFDPCLLSNSITWNEYVNFYPGENADRYELYVSEDGGPVELLNTSGQGQTTFDHTDLSSNTTYQYFVRAFSADGLKSSSSCVKEFTTYDSPRPDFLYVRQATVVDNQYVDILFYTDTSTTVNLYRVLRSEFPGGPFQEIGTVLPTGDEILSFTDADAAIGDRSYYYKIAVIDSCNIESGIGNHGRTIFLTV